MQKKARNQKIKITFIVLGILALILLLGVLIKDKINTKNNLQALNEAILNTSLIPAGSSTGYTLSYSEENPSDAPLKTNRQLVYRLQPEKGYHFLETTTDESGDGIYSRVFGKPGEYYSDRGKEWEKKNVGTDSRATPYSITRLTAAVSAGQIHSIQKIEVGERTGYRVSFNRQWLVSSYSGAGSPLDSEVTYLLGKANGKPIIDSMTQKLRSRIHSEEEKYIAVVEESTLFRANQTEDGEDPAKYLERYFNENIKNNWTLEKPEEAKPEVPAPAETIGDSTTK